MSSLAESSWWMLACSTGRVPAAGAAGAGLACLVGDIVGEVRIRAGKMPALPDFSLRWGKRDPCSVKHSAAVSEV